MEKNIKKRINFVENKVNLLLYNIWRSYKIAKNSMSPYASYIDPAAHSEYQNLVKQGYIIKIENKQGKHFWKLTNKGRNMAELINFVMGKKPKWDKRWRVLVFDIPENLKYCRNFLRRKLKELGFVMLQRSVWVTPWPIPESFSWFLNKYRIGKYVRFMVVEEINFDEDLKKKFDL